MYGVILRPLDVRIHLLRTELGKALQGLTSCEVLRPRFNDPWEQLLLGLFMSHSACSLCSSGPTGPDAVKPSEVPVVPWLA